MKLGVLVNDTIFVHGKVNERLKRELAVQKMRKDEDENSIILFIYGSASKEDTKLEKSLVANNITFDEIYYLGPTLDINDLVMTIEKRGIKTFISNDTSLNAHITRVLKDKVNTVSIIENSNNKVCQEEDMVNHPNHYAQTKIECIEAIEAMVEPYKNSVDAILSYQVLKYLWRHPFKNNPLEDLKKCQWYLNRLIKHYEAGEIKSQAL